MLIVNRGLSVHFSHGLDPNWYCSVFSLLRWLQYIRHPEWWHCSGRQFTRSAKNWIYVWNTTLLRCEITVLKSACKNWTELPRSAGDSSQRNLIIFMCKNHDSIELKYCNEIYFESKIFLFLSGVAFWCAQYSTATRAAVNTYSPSCMLSGFSWYMLTNVLHNPRGVPFVYSLMCT